jgi:ABC-type molybdate transport system permease subunit
MSLPGQGEGPPTVEAPPSVSLRDVTKRFGDVVAVRGIDLDIARGTLPLIAPAVLAAALLTFALSIDDFVITNFNAGSTVTYPLYIWGAARVSIPPQVNVLAAMIFLFTLAMMIFTVWQQQRAERLAAVRPVEG